ncbi:MAG: Ig-like domain-containing protein [Oscillospiraceae bacterium]|nr:Ig-like domain-containing protein [Oscillospiraceae bacterium]
MNNDRTNVIDVDIKALGDAQIVCGVNSTFEISGVIDAPLSSWGGSGFYIIINGTGTFKQEVRSYSNSLTINGGTFEGPVYAASSCPASIYGGTFLGRVYAETGEGKSASMRIYGGVYTPLEGDYDSLYEFISGHLGEGKNIIDVVPGTTFMVGVAEAEVNVEPSELTLYINEENKTFELKAEVTPKGLPVAWESSDPEIVTVDENGAVTAIAKGNATVTARVTLFVDGDGVVFEDTCEVTVAERMSPPPVPDPIKDEPEDDGKLPFDDVNEDDWYYEYVKEVYAEDAMKWAVAEKLIEGSAGKLNPRDEAKRSEVAAVISRFLSITK